ncbi:tRNA pseudouridine synthase C [Minicystis rosea]|nr:tRNA pseudouridine synthase C [Minicystis rosea]
MSLLTLIHRDDRLAAFSKASGLLVHRGWGNDDIVAVELARAATGVRVFPVHRLDRATSGVLLFALDAECAAALGRAFEEGAIHKTYLALVRGVAPEAGVIDNPVPKSEDGPRVPAVTAFRRRHAGERWSLVEAEPRTGRLHQIRRHLKHISHPIVGDVNYGKGDINRLFRERFGLRRLALHAAALRFRHPFSGEAMTLHADIPADLAEPFAQMGIPESALAAAPASEGETRRDAT